MCTFFLEKFQKIPFISVYFSLFPFFVTMVFGAGSPPGGLPDITRVLAWPRDIIGAPMGPGAVMLQVYAAHLRERDRIQNAVTASALRARDPADQGLPIA